MRPDMGALRRSPALLENGATLTGGNYRARRLHTKSTRPALKALSGAPAPANGRAVFPCRLPTAEGLVAGS